MCVFVCVAHLLKKKTAAMKAMKVMKKKAAMKAMKVMKKKDAPPWGAN